MTGGRACTLVIVGALLGTGLGILLMATPRPEIALALWLLALALAWGILAAVEHR